MKFHCKNELSLLSFDEAVVKEFKIEKDTIQMQFSGGVVKADNSQNGRFQDMFCGEITLWLHQAKLVKIVKEGMKYYDANGVLQEEIPNEDVPVPAQDAVLARVAGGTVFTTVEAQVSQGKGLELGIDTPRKRIRKKWILTGFAWSMRKRKRDGRDTALRWMNNGIKSIAVFSDGCQRTEFYQSGQPASHYPAYPFKAAGGAGRGTGNGFI